jgi:hypothetical protein
MGQAKQRGPQSARIEQAKAKIDALKPEKIVCNHCKADISEIQALDSRGMEGITAIFSGSCTCGHSTLAVMGDPNAAAEVMMAFQASMGAEGIIGSQPLLKR